MEFQHFHLDSEGLCWLCTLPFSHHVWLLIFLFEKRSTKMGLRWGLFSSTSTTLHLLFSHAACSIMDQLSMFCSVSERLNSSSYQIRQKTRTQYHAYECVCGYVSDNKHRPVECSRMVRLQEERGQKDNDHSVSFIAYIIAPPLRCMSKLQTHTVFKTL